MILTIKYVVEVTDQDKLHRVARLWDGSVYDDLDDVDDSTAIQIILDYYGSEDINPVIVGFRITEQSLEDLTV